MNKSLRINIFVFFFLSYIEYICSAIENESYDYISATYYLLAERHLKSVLLENLAQQIPEVVAIPKPHSASNSSASLFSSGALHQSGDSVFSGESLPRKNTE